MRKKELKPSGVFLFIDDEEIEHEMFCRALSGICDNEVKHAYNGEQALKVIRENLDDIFMIICDINMPRVNGLELKRIIEGTPELKLRAIPFIFTSTSDDPVLIKEAYALGIQGYIVKPDDITESVQHLDLLVKFWTNIAHPKKYR